MINLQNRGLYKFDFDEEILAYCKSDVDILYHACIEFRRIFMSLTTVDTDNGEKFKGIDPCRDTCTLASVCNIVYRALFMPKNSVAIIPNRGYQPRKQASAKGLRWLHTIRAKEKCTIQDAKHPGVDKNPVNLGEFKVPGMGYVDGYRIEKIKMVV